MWAKSLFFSSRESNSDLRALFDFVQASLTPAGSDSWKGPVLLVDDLGVLLSLGATPVAVLDFIHYCRVAVCSQLKVLLPPRVTGAEEPLEGFGFQEIQIIALGPLSGSCVSPWSTCVRPFATGFPGGAAQGKVLSVRDV